MLLSIKFRFLIILSGLIIFACNKGKSVSNNEKASQNKPEIIRKSVKSWEILKTRSYLTKENRVPKKIDNIKNGSVKKLTLVAVGDIMAQSMLINFVENRTKRGWTGIYDAFSSTIHNADLAFANLEVTVATETWSDKERHKHQLFHCPHFNSHEIMIKGLRSAGFDLLSIANNHIFDHGPKGMISTYNFITKNGLKAIGGGSDSVPKLKIVNTNGVKIGFIGATSFINTKNWYWKLKKYWIQKLRFKSKYAINRFCKRIRKWREEVDLLIMSYHWGYELFPGPGKRQIAVAKQLVKSGVDILLGHHPHVLQPVDIITSKRGKAVVAYSMGNSYSAMGVRLNNKLEDIKLRVNDSVIMKFSIEFQQGKHTVIHTSYIPAFMLKTIENRKRVYRLVHLRRELRTLKKADDCIFMSRNLCKLYTKRLNYITKLYHNLKEIEE